MFLLHNEHLFTPSHFTLVAHPSATSEGSLYHSDGSFSRTDVPGSQYRVLKGQAVNFDNGCLKEPIQAKGDPSLLVTSQPPCLSPNTAASADPPPETSRVHAWALPRPGG